MWEFIHTLAQSVILKLILDAVFKAYKYFGGMQRHTHRHTHVHIPLSTLSLLDVHIKAYNACYVCGDRQ